MTPHTDAPMPTQAMPSQAEQMDGAGTTDIRPPRRGRERGKTTLVLLIPVILLAAIVITVASNGDRMLNGFGHNPPSADELLVERTEFHPGRIDIEVVNPQRAAITPAFVTVDSAIINDLEIVGGGRAIGAHDRRTLRFPYDWDQDDPYFIGIVSSTGVTTEIEVPAATPYASVSRRGIGWGALIGALVGFVPVALGLAWLPALRQLSREALAGFLAFTAGLLAFLAVEATAEALDTQAALIPAVGGASVVVMGIVVSMVTLSLVGRALRKGATVASSGAALSGGTLAVLIAVGIGLHNLGEGLAIGSSFATGEASLAIGLVIGFMIHNLTEGIGIASPIAREGRPLGIVRGIALALLAGLPAIIGIWAGRYISGPLFTTICFSIAAGAALQVIIEITRSLRREEDFSWSAAHLQIGFAGGLLVMWSTGILAG